MHELAILTDARGFTCACALGDIHREISRHPLHAPITVYFWKRTSLDWKLLHIFSYPTEW